MIKPFISLIVVLILMIFTMGAHSLFFSYKTRTDTMQTMVKLTQLSSLSLSVAYDETTFNPTYPEMPTLARRDFIYVK